MKTINPLLLTDGYKTGHHQQYPEGTTLVYSNFTPRSLKHAPKHCNEIVSFGQQMVMRIIHESFDRDFFSQPKEVVCGEMKRELSLYLNTDYDVSHFEALWDLQYLPIKVKAIEEGNIVSAKIPVLTIYNTLPEFYWITNYLETIISNLLWKPMTSATIAHNYRKVLTSWQEKTDAERGWFIDWQGHDFSMRGMDSIDATISSGIGHLASFSGSDSLPAIYGARKYYDETGFISGSVNATEHSVMCAGTKDDEVGTFRRLLETYPTGILSVVSDTWDLWKVCTEHVVTLKEEIMNRDGKLVIRPDSGDPVDILCGTQRMADDACNKSPERHGVIELLWGVFGGTINEQGYKVLDPHIGAIYGDSITIDRADEICERLEAKGFASTNVVLGIGSFTYQYNTRDTFGFAMKATYVEVKHWDVATERLNEAFDKNSNPEWIEGREIFKDPITDDGTKKSATGLLCVKKDYDGKYTLIDKVTWEGENTGELKTIYSNGNFYNITTLTEIRQRLSRVLEAV
jgi:nicotinamide phosphoribosyltransferase